MIRRFTDPSAIAALNHSEVLAWLRAQGWEVRDQIRDVAHVMIHPGQSDRELVVPARGTVGDYGPRMAELVATLAELQDRPASAVLADMQTAGNDVIRLRAPHTDGIHSLPVDDGLGLIAAGRNLLLSAACAAHAPRAAYHLGKVAEANAYLRSVRLGQTERGSFVLTLLSPVDPRLSVQSVLPGMEEEPFSRQVTRTLARALQSLRVALVKANTEGFDAFENAVPKGVSANLCEATAALIEHGNGFECGVSWAATRPGPTDLAVRATFAPSDAPALRSAARAFHAREPDLDHELVGYVINVGRSIEEFDGSAIVQTIVDGRQRRVRMRFDQADFPTVIRSISDKVPLNIIGDLVRSGARYELRRPRHVELMSETAEEETEST